MGLGAFTYLVSVFVFAGGAILIELVLGGAEELRDYRRIVLAMLLLGLPFVSVGESVALHLGIWGYGHASFQYLIFGAEAETYLFFELVVIAIATATLFFSDVEEMEGSFYKAVAERARAALRFIRRRM